MKHKKTFHTIINKLPTRILNSGQVFLLRVIGMALSYLVMIYISNLFGAKVFGRYSLSVALWQFLLLVFSLGIPQVVLKLTADINNHDEQPKNNYLSIAIKILLLSSVFCSLFLYSLKEKIAIYVFDDYMMGTYIKYIAYFFMFGAFHAFIAEYLRAKRLFLKFGLFMYSAPYVLILCLLFVFHLLKLNESSTFLSFVISFSLLCCVMLFYLPNKKSKKKTYSFKSILSLSFPMLLSSTFLFISNWTDVFMLGIMSSKENVGIYTASFKLATIALIVINAVNTVLAPKISELFSKNDIDGIKEEVQKATRLITLITIPIVILLILFRAQLLAIFGPEFQEKGQTVLIVIAVGLLFNALSGSVGQVLNMTMHQKKLRNFTIISAFCNIVLNYFLISTFGILGAAIASLISNILLNGLCVIYIKKEFNFLAVFKP